MKFTGNHRITFECPYATCEWSKCLQQPSVWTLCASAVAAAQREVLRGLTFVPDKKARAGDVNAMKLPR
jgi:hypothetical protein